MNSLIDAAFKRTRTVVLAFFMIVVMGAVAYTTIPKESPTSRASTPACSARRVNMAS